MKNEISSHHVTSRDNLASKNIGWGYTYDGRADKNPYPHDCRADKDSYPHDRMWLTICVA